MKLWVHVMAVGTFAPMLESLASILDKGSGYAASSKLDLVKAKLAPDMLTLARQVQMACHFATDATPRLAGRPTTAMEEPEKTIAGLIAQIRRALGYVRSVPAAAFGGAEERRL